MPRKGGFIFRETFFLHFALRSTQKTGHFRILQVLFFLLFGMHFFKIGSPEFPPTTQQFQAMWLQPNKGNGKKAWDPKLSPTGVMTIAQTFSFEAKCHSILKKANSVTVVIVISAALGASSTDIEVWKVQK